jgi:hypothetical protein
MTRATPSFRGASATKQSCLREHVQNTLNAKLITGRCTLGIILELARRVVTNTHNIGVIIDEIGRLSRRPAHR